MDNAVQTPIPSEAPAATETTPLLPGPAPNSGTDENTPTQQSGPIRLAIWGQRILLTDGLVVAVLALAVPFVAALTGPPRYSLPWIVGDASPQLLTTGLLSFVWAAANLAHFNLNQRFLHRIINTLIHAVLAMYVLAAAVAAMITLYEDSGRACSIYGQDPEEGYFKCKKWAIKFHVMVWIYLALAVALGLTHILMFVLSCSSTWWGGTPGMPWPSMPGPGPWRFPAGQISVEFTIKFLRQQDAPRDLERNQESGTTGP
ncbi:hypothetical protein QBC47DRAFT_120603 [Echria macrotheca]|uniref:Uncharacterized protein n=1 Tax=Echria macrotheca TaxID=438768 RepID=A0AAJ0B2G4_9PEZI|nr:hypothetical protein QBC47DRAFT_120603 [Echria macrotheca]